MAYRLRVLIPTSWSLESRFPGLNRGTMKPFSYLIGWLAIAVGLLFFFGAAFSVFTGGGAGAAILILLSLLLVLAGESHYQRSCLKVCPACAELIRPQALKCRFCGHIFTTSGSGASNF